MHVILSVAKDPRISLLFVPNPRQSAVGFRTNNSE